MGVVHCSCGASQSELLEGGPVRIIHSWNFSEIKAFYAGEFDQPAKCDAGCPLPVPATLIWLEELKPIIYPGPLLRGHEHRLTNLLPTPDGEELSFGVADGPDHLRAMARSILEQRMGQAGELELLIREAGETGWQEQVLNTWRFRTPELIAALQAAQGNIVQGYLNENNSTGEVGQWIAQRVLEAWLGLTFEWCGGGPTATQSIFEDDLSRYIDRMPTFPGLADRYCALVANLDLGEHAQARRYLLEVIKGSVVSAHGTGKRSFKDNFGCAYIYFTFFLAWKSFERRAQDGDEGAASLAVGMQRSMISAERAASLIEQEAALAAITNISGRLFDEGGLEELKSSIGALVLAASHASLPFTEATISDAMEMDAPVDSLQQAVAAAARDGNQDILLQLGLATRRLARERRIEDVVAVADSAIAAAVRDSDRVAAVAWLCNYLMGVRWYDESNRRFAQLSEAEINSLEVEEREDLFATQVDAMRGLGRYDEALALANQAIGETKDGSTPPLTLIYQRALVLRDSGAPDHALSELLGLLSHWPAEQPPYFIAQSIGWTYRTLGDATNALKWLTIAERDARTLGNFDPSMQLQLMLAQMEANEEVDSDLITRLGGPDEPQSMQAAVMEMTVLSMLAERGKLPLSLLGRLQSVKAAISQLAQDAALHGDVAIQETALRSLAASQDGSADEWWDRLAELHDSTPSLPHDIVLVKRMLDSFAGDDLAMGISTLRQMPEAVLRHVEGVSDFAVSIDAGVRLQATFDYAFARLAGSNLISPADKRILAEIRRDYVGRAMMMQAGRSTVKQAIQGAFSDDVLAQVIDEPVTVLDLSLASGASLLLKTVVSMDAVVTSEVDPPVMALEYLSGKLGRRLKNWTPQRPGDPFAISEWDEFVGWLEGVLPSNTGHLVVMPGPLGDLPWHVAAAMHRYTCSYAQGWTDLLHAIGDSRPELDRRVSIASVTRVGDPVELGASFVAAIEIIRTAAERSGSAVSSAIGSACDATTLRRMMSDSDFAVWLLHAYVDATTSEAAIMLAHDGRLPLAHDVASNSPHGRQHTLNWSAMNGGAPRIVVSGACSSGLSHPRGMEDRAGFYSKLRHNGTRSFVAPRWDVHHSSLPVLAHAVELMLIERIPAATAVYRAGVAAFESGVPRWISFPFSVEGSWR